MAQQHQSPGPSTSKDQAKPPSAVQEEAISAPDNQPLSSAAAMRMPQARPVPANLFALQQTVGNQAVQRMLEPPAQRAASARVQRALILDGLGERVTPGLRILLANITSEMSQADQLTQLVRNFRDTNFTYSMLYKQNFRPLIAAGALGEGDCATLSEAMIHVAETYLGIEGMGKKHVADLYVGSSARTIDRGKQPNVNSGEAWVFESHTWVTGPGGEYDPLFGDVLSQAGWKLKSATERIPDTKLDKDTYGDVVLVGPVMKPDLSKEYLTFSEALKLRDIDQQNKDLFMPKKAPKKKSGFCYITTACTESRGLPDDCDELMTLRHFRDTYMQTLANGPQLIEEYYEKSPLIVAAIKRRPDARQVFSQIYDRIVETVALIKAGANQQAFERYCVIVLGLNQQYVEGA